MPGMGVVDPIRALRSEGRSPRILVLSVHPERHYARRVLEAGADGYLTKNHSPTALADAIRQVHGGRKYVTPALAEELAVSLSQGSALAPHEALSNREYEAFRRMGAGVAVNTIADALALNPKAVRTYRSRILEGLGIGFDFDKTFTRGKGHLDAVVPAVTVCSTLTVRMGESDFAFDQATYPKGCQ